MHNKLRFIALFVLMFGLMIASTSAQEAIAVGDSVEATADGAEVEFEISLSAGESVLVDLEADFSSVVTIRNSGGDVVGGGEGGGSGWNDTRAVFIAPADDTYTIVVAARFGMPSGDYTLSVSEQEVTMLTLGETFTTTDAAGTVFAYYAFEGKAGDVVNIFATAFDTSDDLKITVYDGLGEEVAADDDGGRRFDPYVRRLALKDDGTYVIFLERIFDREMVGNYEITVEATEALTLDADGMTVTLGDDLGYEVFTLSATSGDVYTLNLSGSSASASARIEIYGPNSDFADNRFTVDTFMEASFTFRATASGETKIRLNHSGFSGTVDYTISLEKR